MAVKMITFRGQILILFYFNGALLTAYLYLYTPIATLSKNWTRLNTQQSMAKHPINGYVSNHIHTC